MAAQLNRGKILKDRAFMLAQAREFFAKRQILEVDCPILTQGASIDANIDLIPARYANLEIRYMHSSPEYGMKRLLAEGISDIYQLSHVFRDAEFSYKHNPEFMMAEWYRLAVSYEFMIAEALDFVRLFLGPLPAYTLSYREALQEYADLDYVKASIPDLIEYLQNRGIQPYAHIEKEGKDALLNLILAMVVEPHLGKDKLCVLTDYPATQAALAQTKWQNDEQVAERFEIYYAGLELANGYHELGDAGEQRKRLMEANQIRNGLGKNQLPIDEAFLEALKKGFPDACGVAVGFDRLMMLRHQASTIAEVIPFAWTTA
ncbi:EF-P lysine aminoacylase EpmA [Neochlamydia sp. AcF95]|uniref:EF-P lysine aminoacylase EpmA n=1 Tax=Neochlamydia sp. AcF95 TaxID=2795734 RepID=UPI001BC90559|nr:EF-P lysine aminoacylase EpmA [Neochlamydia sp. AcF95]MBS4170678.1 Elongation factor P--(R)-beta-lysine ligase [Neochlamydia sp. AcF95]